MPFFTAFASANPGMRVPVLCYCGWLAIAGAANRRLQTIVTSAPVLDESVSADLVAATRERGTSVILGAVTGMVVGWFVPVAGQVMLCTIPLWRLALRRLSARPR
jgi:hypothetical protein